MMCGMVRLGMVWLGMASQSGASPLHRAAEAGHVALAQELLDHGARADAVDQVVMCTVAYSTGV